MLTTDARAARLASDALRLRMRLADATIVCTAMGESLKHYLHEIGHLRDAAPGLVAVVEAYEEWRRQEHSDG